MRYLREGITEQIKAPAGTEIVFNYLGDPGISASTVQGDELFRYAAENKGVNIHPSYERDSIITVTGVTMDRQLHMDIQYSECQLNRVTVEKLSKSYKENLLRIIYLLNGRQGSYELSCHQLSYFRNKTFAHAFDVLSFRLPDFEKARFLNACKKLLAEFPILRMKFALKGDDPVQEVSDGWDSGYSVRFAAVTPGIDETGAEGLFSDMLARPFALPKGEVIRIGVKHDGKDADVLLVIHHIVTDGYSNTILKRRLLGYYRDEDLPPAGGSYLDYIEAQQVYLRSEEARQKIRFWRDHLEQFGIERKMLGEGYRLSGSMKAVLNQWTLAGEEYEKMREICRKEKIFLSCFMLNLFYLFAKSQYAERGSLLAGIVVNGRDMEIPGFVVGDTIGQFVNVLPLVLPGNTGMTWLQSALRVQEAYMEGRMRQEIPLARIEEDFVEAHGIPLSKNLDLELDLTNSMDKMFPGIPQYHTRVSDGGGIDRKECLVVKCREYRNAVQLEWSLMCPEEVAATYTGQNYFIHKVSDLLSSMMQDRPLQ